MRDKQLATFLETWNGFATGMISSEKPFSCKGLSEVLELDVSEKYYLSPRACQGILRRYKSELSSAGIQALEHSIEALKITSLSTPTVLGLQRPGK